MHRRDWRSILPLIPSKYIEYLFKDHPDVLANLIRPKVLYTLLMDKQTNDPANEQGDTYKIVNYFTKYIPVQDTMILMLSRLLRDEIVITVDN